MPESIKLFSDGADLPSLLEMAKNQKIPALHEPNVDAQSRRHELRGFCSPSPRAHQGPANPFEVFADEFDAMAEQAKKIAAWARTCTSKCDHHHAWRFLGGADPGSLGQRARAAERHGAVARWSSVHETSQALRGGAPAVISVFAGRIADTGRDPVPLMKAARAIIDASGADAELLWASPRETAHIVQAEQAGAQIITVPRRC